MQFFKSFMRFMIISAAAAAAAAQPADDTAVFKRVFGVERKIDAATMEAVNDLAPGERLERDTNGDGAVDEIWYLDTAKRHNIDPLLVRVVDEDGDLAQTGRGDYDSDCYYWDHNADGYFDVVTDYVDDDGDNDVDQMGIFYDKRWPDEKDDITVWWSVDIGDDNLLWFDVNGNYYQPLCQWRTHFGGDELFYQFRLTEDDGKWVNVWEDPFAFYDLDDDGASEMIIRISAIGDDVKNLRYSIDADDDAYGERTRNYDFSVTALPPESGLSTADWSGSPLTIRGIETLPLLSWKDTPAYSQQAKWGKAMLTWDEINSNTDQNPDQDPHERWEGILNHASKHDDFEQVGGPPSSPYNKRVEVSHAPDSPLQLKYSETDHRFHLVGAKYGYLDVDFNFDGELDAAYTWADSDGDGLLDRRRADVDADGAVDFEQVLSTNGNSYHLQFGQIAPAYKQALHDQQSSSQRFIDAARGALESVPSDVLQVVDYFTGPLTEYHPETELGEYIQKSPAGALFYTGLVRDRYFVHVRSTHEAHADWDQVEAAFLDGDYASAAEALVRITGTALPEDSSARPLIVGESRYTDRLKLAIGYDQTQSQPRDDVPCSISVDELRRIAPNFNPANCVVVDGDFRLAWRAIPHQVDAWEFGGGERISFLADLPADGAKTYYIYYATGDRAYEYPQLTNAVLENPGHAAWESDAGAYRFYTGQFDFFGKHVSRTIPRAERLIYPLVDVNYHAELDWGMDALHVGKTSGLGGLTLFVGDKAYPVQSPAGEGNVAFEYEVLGAGPVRSCVAIKASNVLTDRPDAVIELRCFAYARNAESEIQVRLPEGLSDPQLAIGLMELPESSAFQDLDRGLIGTWGRPGDDIGEVGLAVVALPGSAREIQQAPEEQKLVCSLPSYGDAGHEAYHLRYWITGVWRRGMQYPIAPTGDDWRRAAEGIAEGLIAKRNVEISHSTTPER